MIIPWPRTSTMSVEALRDRAQALHQVAAHRGGVFEHAAPSRSASSTASAAAHATGLPPKVVPWVPGVRLAATSGRAIIAPIGKSAAERLGQRHDVGLDAGVLMAEQLAGAAHPDLHLVEDQQQLVAIAQVRAAAAGNRCFGTTTPPSPWIGSTMMATVCSLIARSTAATSSYGTSRKPGTHRLKSLMVLLLAGGAQRRHRAAMEGVERRDDLEAAAAVRRWPHRRASLIAASLTSAPELPKNTGAVAEHCAPGARPAAPSARCETRWRRESAFRPAP